MRFTSLAVALLSASLLMVGCARDSATAPDTAQANAPTRALNNDEAIRVVREYFEQAFTKCGDSYYGRANRVEAENSILQFQNVTFRAMGDKPLTEADRLNGVERIVTVEVNWSANRRYLTRDRSWTPWERPGGISLPAAPKQYQAIKTSSGWRASGFDFGGQFGHRPIDCSEIPQ